MLKKLSQEVFEQSAFSVLGLSVPQVRRVCIADPLTSDVDLIPTMVVVKQRRFGWILEFIFQALCNEVSQVGNKDERGNSLHHAKLRTDVKIKIEPSPHFQQIKARECGATMKP